MKKGRKVITLRILGGIFSIGGIIVAIILFKTGAGKIPIGAACISGMLIGWPLFGCADKIKYRKE